MFGHHFPESADCAKYYEHWTVFEETTAPQIWQVFFPRHTVVNELTQ